MVLCLPLSSGALTLDEATARFRVVNQLAREMNDRPLVESVGKAGRSAERFINSGENAKADALLCELEAKVGIDPGGWAMAGLPIFRPTHETEAAMKTLSAKLNEAMRSGDAAVVTDVCRELMKALGTQAGTPDARRKGDRAEPRKISEAGATRLFIDALESEGKSMRAIMAARPLPDQMMRTYGYAVSALCEAHPLIAKHVPENLADAERVIRGGCKIMIDLQQPEGHFPFPDLRGKNIRFGAMAEKHLQDEGGKVVSGWLVTPDPAGGSQFDTGLCGSALLQAGRLLREDSWTKAGLRAADWAAGQPGASNFNYNAFSITLLAQAFVTTNEIKYLDAALIKWRVGVATGQAANGRWADPHNARTVYHHIIVRAMNDLLESLPVERAAEREEIRSALAKAMQPMLAEFEALGITVHCLRELVRYRDLTHSADPTLIKAIDDSVSVMLAKCKRGDRARMGVPPGEFPWLAKTANP